MEGLERRGEEDVKCSTFTHLLLYRRSLRERERERKKKKTKKQMGPWCKKSGLWSLVLRLVGLDGIRQLPRMC